MHFIGDLPFAILAQQRNGFRTILEFELKWRDDDAISISIQCVCINGYHRNWCCCCWYQLDIGSGTLACESLSVCLCRHCVFNTLLVMPSLDFWDEAPSFDSFVHTIQYDCNSTAGLFYYNLLVAFHRLSISSLVRLGFIIAYYIETRQHCKAF